MSFYLLDHSSVNGTQWQQWAYPRRGASLSGTCIIHTAESVLDNVGPDAGAEDCAAFIARRTGSYGSYHTLVDSDSIIELAPYEYETWQDSETNNWAVGISAACRTTDWATMGEAQQEGYYRNLARAAADFVTYMRTKGIEVPRKKISGIDARNRVPGFCAHGDSGVARSDPGKDFDWDRFFRYTNEELNGVDEVTTPAQINEIVHKINVFAQRNALDVGAITINEVRVHTKHNADRILEALKQIPQIPDDLIVKLKTELDTELDETLEQVTKRLEDKLGNISVILTNKPSE